MIMGLRLLQFASWTLVEAKIFSHFFKGLDKRRVVKAAVLQASICAEGEASTRHDMYAIAAPSL